MSWRDVVKGPASFRGVTFWITGSDFAGGRRGELNQFPFRDTPYFDDTGREARTFPVEGFVIGDDYMNARDDLISSLEQSGPGELVHPYFGTVRAVATKFRVRESAEEGGLARFSIDFVEAEATPSLPAASVDVSEAALDSVDAAQVSTQMVFLAAYQPGPLLSSVSTALANAAAQISAIGALSALDGQALASFSASVGSFTDSIASLVISPSDLYDALSALVGSLEGDAASILPLYSFDPGTRPLSTTPERLQEQANFDAVQRLLQRLVLLRAAQLLVAQTFTSYEDAVTARDAVTDLFDDQAEVATDDTFPALTQLRADLVSAVPGDGQGLPHLLQFTPPITVPSLVLAQRLYGNVDREQDLIDRNGVENPAFMLGGVALEVLSDG